MSFLSDETGAVSVEYGFAVLFAGLVAGSVMTTAKNEVSDSFDFINVRMKSLIDQVGSTNTAPPGDGTGGAPPPE